MRGWLLNWISVINGRRELQPEPVCPPKFHASIFDRIDSRRIESMVNTSSHRLYVFRIIHIQRLYYIICSNFIIATLSSLRAGLLIFLLYIENIANICICILIIRRFVITIPYRLPGLDSDWLTCSVNITICLPLSDPSSGEITLIYTSLWLLRFPSRVVRRRWAH